jgi:hypothetical protein
VYHNISNVLSELDVGIYSASGDWTNENNRPLLCELEDDFVRAFVFALWLGRKAPFF